MSSINRRQLLAYSAGAALLTLPKKAQTQQRRQAPKLVLVFATAAQLLFGQIVANPAGQYNCRDPNVPPWNGAPFPALMYADYNAYIPGDNVVGGTPCFYFIGGGFYPFSKHYKGDGYPVQDFFPVTPARVFHGLHFYSITNQQAGIPLHDASQTRAYGAFSPVNGYTLSNGDEDGVPWDCFLWHGSGYADMSGLAENVTFPYPTQAQVQLWGSAANPLDNVPGATIKWFVNVEQDYTNPDWVTAYASVTHTCFPAHVVKAQGATLYHYMPPRNDPAYIFDCWVNSGSNMTVGVVTPTRRVPCQ